VKIDDVLFLFYFLWKWNEPLSETKCEIQ
jgi:hypothetical protein